MHGGKSTSPQPKHGRYTRAAIEKRREMRGLARVVRAIASGRIGRLDPGTTLPILTGRKRR
jgi:hypothetical protein